MKEAPQQLEFRLDYRYGARVVPRPDLGEGAVLVIPAKRPVLLEAEEELIGPEETARLLGLSVGTVRSHPHRFGALQRGRYCRLRFPKRKIMELRTRQRLN